MSEFIKWATVWTHSTLIKLFAPVDTIWTWNNITKWFLSLTVRRLLFIFPNHCQKKEKSWKMERNLRKSPKFNCSAKLTVLDWLARGLKKGVIWWRASHVRSSLCIWTLHAHQQGKSFLLFPAISRGKIGHWMLHYYHGKRISFKGAESSALSRDRNWPPGLTHSCQ